MFFFRKNSFASVFEKKIYELILKNLKKIFKNYILYILKIKYILLNNINLFFVILN